MSTIIVDASLTHLLCPDCGGVYAIAENYLNEAREKGNFKQCWKCPYCGVSRGYGKSRIDELKEEIALLQRSKDYLDTQRRNAELEAEHFRKSRDGIRGALTKIQQRVTRGVCPCCKRHFTDLERHMATKHAKAVAFAARSS